MINEVLYFIIKLEKENIILLGRRRWKIENKGFKESLAIYCEVSGASTKKGGWSDGQLVSLFFAPSAPLFPLQKHTVKAPF